MHAKRMDRRSLVSRRRGLWITLLLLLLPAGLAAQEREIVSSEIAVSSTEATLRVDFAGDSRLDVTFRDGTVSIDGSPVGSYSRGDALDIAWRSLLGRAVALEGSALAELLRGWEPPADATTDVAQALDRALEASLMAAPPTPPQEPAAAPDQGDLSRQIDGAIIERLLGRADRLSELSSAIAGLNLNGVRIHVGEPVTVQADEDVQGSLLVVDGNVDLYGEIRGNIVILGGQLTLHPGSRVTGDVRWADGSVTGERGVVEGQIRRVRAAAAPTVAPDAPRTVTRERTERPRRGVLAPLRHIGQGLAGLFQNVVSLGVMTLIGFVVLHFGRSNLDVVARTAKRSPMRCWATGFAGFFLFVPVWILGIVALAISLVGIPVLLAWIPLFPVAVAAAILFGYIAMALILGEWLAEQRFERLEWLRGASPLMAMFAGFGLLLLPFMAANVVRMGGPWLGFLQGLFTVVGVVGGGIIVTMGFGAILLSRGGRRTDWAWTPSFDPGSGPGGSEDDIDDWMYPEYAADPRASPERAPGAQSPGERPSRQEDRPGSSSRTSGHTDPAGGEGPEAAPHRDADPSSTRGEDSER